jgi:hypothetical protein
VSNPLREQHPDWFIDRDGKEFVLYKGLLALAHDRGLLGITVTVVQLPSEMNGSTAVCSASVQMPDKTFSEVGDASPTNVTRMMAPHIIRMAATRAKARALRDAVNIGVTAFEELGQDTGDDAPARTATRSPGVVTRGQERINQDNGRTGAGVGTAAPRPAGPGPYERGGVAGGPLEAPDWPHQAAEELPHRPMADVGPTPKQRETLHKFGVREIPEGMTRKEASDLITQKIEEAEARRQGR